MIEKATGILSESCRMRGGAVPFDGLKLSSGLIDLNTSGRVDPAELEAGTGPGLISAPSCLCQPPDLGGYGYEPTRETSDTYRHRHSRWHLYHLCDPRSGCLIRRAGHLGRIVPENRRRR
jgi:hypothetical protein